MIAIALALAIAGGLTWYLRRATPVEPVPDVSHALDVSDSPQVSPEYPSGPAPDTDQDNAVNHVIQQPPPETLEEADEFLRGEFEGEDTVTNDLLSHDHIIDKVAAVADAIWRGENPSPSLNFLSPKGKLEVEYKDGSYYLSERNYSRYQPYLKALTSADEQRLVSTYLHLRPILRQAHAQLGNPHRQWDQLVDEVLQRLSEAKLPESDPQLVNTGSFYIFNDPELEALAPAHKVLIRMGPEQATQFQEKLKRLRQRLNQSTASEKGDTRP